MPEFKIIPKKFQAGHLGKTWQTDSEVYQEEETTRTKKKK